jgi:hypothetical protein
MKQLRFAVAVFISLAGLSNLSWAQDPSTQYYNAGNSLYAGKNYDQAIRYYQAAVQGNPHFWQAYQALGNCYYAKGDNNNALTNYNKALSLYPNNPQLSQFVQTLQAKTAPASPAANNNSSGAASPATGSPAKAGRAPKMFELEPMIGLGVGAGMSYGATLSAPATTIDAGTGIGGGVGGYYLLDNHLAVGLIIDYFAYTKSTSGPATFFTPSFQQTVATQTNSGNFDSVEVLPSVKFKFGEDSFRPYLMGSLGFSFASTSYSVSYGSFSNGQPGPGQAQGGTATGPSYSGPMIQVGGGGEYALGPDMNLFLQLKYSMIFVGSTTYQSNPYQGFTFSSIPIVAGVNFDF